MELPINYGKRKKWRFRLRPNPLKVDKPEPPKQHHILIKEGIALPDVSHDLVQDGKLTETALLGKAKPNRKINELAKLNADLNIQLQDLRNRSENLNDVRDEQEYQAILKELSYPRTSLLLRIIKALKTIIPVKVEVDPAIKSYVKSNPGSPLIISFMVLLIFSAVSLIQGNSAFANELAIYAYYALVGGVVLQIASFVIKRPKEGEQ